MSAIEGFPGFTIGCDPEVFIKNEKGVHVSAAGLIPGTKKNPHRVKGGAVQVDGMAAEINTNPASDFPTFNANINAVMKELTGMLPEGYTLDIVPSVVFDEEVFDAAPDDAKELGCSPDFNAWTGEVNSPPSDPENPRLRTAAGHIHFGWGSGLQNSDEQHIMNCRDFVKQLDWHVGAWSVRLDGDTVRRRLYGKAGAYRPKSYGVEYRVPSNFWLTSRDRRLAMWNRIQRAIQDMRRAYLPDKVKPSENQLLIEMINTSKRNKDLEGKYKYPIQTDNPMYSFY